MSPLAAFLIGLVVGAIAGIVVGAIAAAEAHAEHVAQVRTLTDALRGLVFKAADAKGEDFDALWDAARAALAAAEAKP